MTILKLCSLLLVSPVMLMIACGGGSATRYTPKHKEIPADSVIITNCDANPDLVDVDDGQTLTWKVPSADRTTYTIAFGDSRPISPKSITASNPSPNAQKIQKDSWCKYAGWAHDLYCVYDYTMTKDDGTVCKDPGVHIIK